MSTKRLFSLILAVAMLVAIVAGCTNQNGAPKQPTGGRNGCTRTV